MFLSLRFLKFVLYVAEVEDRSEMELMGDIGGSIAVACKKKVSQSCDVWMNH